MNDSIMRQSTENFEVQKTENPNSVPRSQSVVSMEMHHQGNESKTNLVPRKSILKMSRGESLRTDSEVVSSSGEFRERRDTAGNPIIKGGKKHSIHFSKELVEVKEVESYKQYNAEAGTDYGTNKCCVLI